MSQEIRMLVRGNNNRQCQMTIGTNYRSGSAIVATTQESDKEGIDRVKVTIDSRKRTSQEIRLLVQGIKKQPTESLTIGTPTGTG
jgi:hypothetical protein